MEYWGINVIFFFTQVQYRIYACYLQESRAEIDPAWVKEQLLWRDTRQYVIAQGSVINTAVIPPASLSLSVSLSVGVD